MQRDLPRFRFAANLHFLTRPSQERLEVSSFTDACLAFIIGTQALPGFIFNVGYECWVITLVPNSSSAEVQALGECAVLGRWPTYKNTRPYTGRKC